MAFCRNLRYIYNISKLLYNYGVFMSKVLKVAISGLGRIAWWYHLPMLENDERFELVAVSDPVEERLKEFSETHPAVHTYTDYNAMLDSEATLDMVVIASPTMFHLPQAVAALEHKLAVFLEKPMCESLESAEKLAAAVERTNGKLMLYQPHRSHLETMVLKNQVLSKLGSINHVRRTLAIFNRRNDWQSRKDCGGGMLNNYGAHYIDQFMHVFGFDLTIDGCLMRRTVGIGDAEDLVSVLMTNKAGISCNLEINLGSAETINTWEVFGSLGCARWDNTQTCWHVTYVEPGTLTELSMQDSLAALGRSYSQEGNIPWIREEIALDSETQINFYDKIYDYFANDLAPFVPLAESMQLMKALADCRKASERN